MENNNLPTIAEAVGNAVDEIKVPSVDSIGDMPTVSVPSVDSVQPAAPQPIQTAQADQPTQPIQMTPPVAQPAAATYAQPTAPTYAQPAAATYAQPAAPTYAQPAAPTYAQPAATYTLPATNYQIPTQNTGKRTAGQIVSLIIGIILTVLFSFFTFCVAVYDIDTYNTQGEVDVEIGAYIILAIPLLIGILLIWLGARKKKNNPVIAPTAAYVPAAPASTGYAAPTAQGYTAPTVSGTAAPAAQEFASPTATVSGTGINTAQPTAPVSSANTLPGTQPTAAPVTNTADYQYAATAIIGDDAEKVARKTARNSGLLAIGCIVIMWVLVFALDLLSWYLLIFPFILSFRAIKSCAKSPAGWFGMVLSILSAVLIVLLMIAAAAM